MIHKIWASDKRFKEVRFREGLNVILGERFGTASKKDTRNGVGKTTLLKVLHFCLGATKLDINIPESFKKEIEDWSFFLEFDLFRHPITVERSVNNPKEIKISSAIQEGLPSELPPDGICTIEEWKELLQKGFFSVNNYKIAGYPPPSFRSLILYFARLEINNNQSPFESFRKQNVYRSRLETAFLLGINWILVEKLSDITKEEKTLESQKKENNISGKGIKGKLEADKTIIEDEISEESDRIKNFNVHPEYKNLLEKANRLTKESHYLVNQAFLLTRQIENYKRAIKEEKPIGTICVAEVFKQAGVLFPENVKRTLREAKNFHETIIQNRKHFLNAEIANLENQLEKKEREIKEKSEEKASLMKILKTQGALEEFLEIKEKLEEKKQKLIQIKATLSKIKEVENKEQEIKGKKNVIEKELLRDYEESVEEWNKAIVLFSKNSQFLYKEPGKLVINSSIKKNGYYFNATIEKDNSQGIALMRLFCYDIMLAELMTKREGIDFLFHDSSIFNGVDSRQKALALQYADTRGKQEKFQYICTLNSDEVPFKDFPKEFNFDNFIRLKLTDENPESTLFGFQF